MMNLFIQRIIIKFEKLIFFLLKKTIKYYFPAKSSSLENNALSRKRIANIEDEIENISKRIEIIYTHQDPWQGSHHVDQKIAALIPSILSEKTFFIEAGANDGVTNSNTYFLEKRFGATGMLIEPSPSNFEKCYRNRSSKNLFEHCALVSEAYKEEYIEMVFDNLKTHREDYTDYKDISNYDPANREKWCNYKFLSPVKTLSSLLTKYDIKKVDFLSLDTEGSEFDILNGANLSSGIIKNIYIEIRDRDQEKIFNFLNKFNYKFLEKLHYGDFLFTLNAKY